MSELFGRQHDLDRLGRTQAERSTLLIGPRRIGKTALQKALRASPPDGVVAVRVDLEGLSDIGGAAERLRSELKQHDLAPAKVLDKIPIQAAEAGGVRVELARAGASPWSAIESLVEAGLGALAKGHVLVLMLDEVPWWLDGLRKSGGDQAAKEALARLRYLRQRDDLSGRLRMVLTGSVGLASLARAIEASAEINDVEILELRPLAEDDGAALFDHELAQRALTCDAETSTAAHALGGGSPHWIKQLASRIEAQDEVQIGHLHAAVEALLAPRMRSLFDDEGHVHLRKRHGEKVGARLSGVLSTASSSDGGVRVEEAVAGALAGGAESRAAAEEAVQLLIDEFYLELGNGVVRFVNPLFRRWWERYGAR